MAKRFFSDKIWEEDWFLEMPVEYRLFWFYMLSACDHSGVFKVNLRPFCSLNYVKILPAKALEFFNLGKNRVRVINPTTWFIEDFFVYQYGDTLNLNNKVHESAAKNYKRLNINVKQIRGLNGVIEKKSKAEKEDKKNP